MSTVTKADAPCVLVVDDDENIKLLMTTLLQRAAIEVDGVRDGEAALRKLRERSYDSIVLDLMLPRMNGFEVVRDLKCRVPEMLKRVIVVTAASNLTLRDFTDSELVRRVIRKPFEIDEFVAEVQACAAEHHTDPAPALSS